LVKAKTASPFNFRYAKAALSFGGVFLCLNWIIMPEEEPITDPFSYSY
jgi:hypothetical protein